MESEEKNVESDMKTGEWDRHMVVGEHLVEKAIKEGLGAHLEHERHVEMSACSWL